MPTRLLVLLICSACGGASTSTGDTRLVVAEPLEPNGENRWAHRTFSQRHETMTFTVLPVLGRGFRGHHDSENAELACITCHGANAETVEYRMPATLPTLDPDNLPQTDEARWMAEFVTPTADRLMRAGGTTTCFSCHPSSANDNHMSNDNIVTEAP